MNLNHSALLSIIIFNSIFFVQCKNDKQLNGNNAKTNDLITVPSNSKPAHPDDDPFLVKTPPGYYKPYGLRPLNIIESYELGKTRPFSNSCPLKDKFGTLVSWDTLLHSPVPLFLQMYVNENNQLVEGVVFESNDTIQGLIMRVRIGKSGN
jgi:hypothetical protein